MKRREFVSLATKGAVGTAAVALAGREAAAGGSKAERKLTWEMATEWPVSLDTIYGGARTVCDTVAELTEGRFIINPHPVGSLSQPGGSMAAVRDGVVPIAHTAADHHMNLGGPFLAFGTGVPFGLTARQQNAWLYAGGGLELLQLLYEERFGILQFPAGNTGAQMGGWFKSEISTLADLLGLRMRIGAPVGAEVMRRLGVEVKSIVSSQILDGFRNGAIDAAEFVGPYDDELLGLHTVADYYYYPGWWEPGSTFEIQINLNAWNELPLPYQNALRVAAYKANMEMLATYDAVNYRALWRLVNDGTQLRPFSDEIMNAAYEATRDVLGEYAFVDSDFAAVYGHWDAFRQGVQSWHSTNELAFMNHVAAL